MGRRLRNARDGRHSSEPRLSCRACGVGYITTMSRAFVKDQEDAVEDLPARPVSTAPNLVTAEGLAAIEAEIATLTEAMAHLCRAPELRARLAKRGKQTVTARFAVGRYMTELQAYYRSGTNVHLKPLPKQSVAAVAASRR